MSKPKTVKELLRGWRGDRWKASPREAELFSGLGIATEGVLLQLGILDYHIIPGAKCVVSEAALLAAGHAYEDAHKAALDTSNYEVGLIAGARACLEAAGIEFADEVVTLRVPGGRKVDANGDLPIRLGSGDILYIKRGD